MSEVKQDCFAFDAEHRTCKALTALYCRRTDCPFYKNDQEHLKQKYSAEKRAKNLYKYLI